MPLALGLWMNKSYGEALDTLQRPGWRRPVVIWSYFHALVGMVARQVNGKHLIGSPGLRACLAD